MSDFVDAVAEARETIHSRDYEPSECIVYCHPLVLDTARDEMDWVAPFNQGAEVFGMTIETTQNVPEGLVMVVHPEAAMYGPDAIAFAWVDQE